MDFLVENLTLLKNTSGWSFDTMADKLKKGLAPDQQFSRDQIIGFLNGKKPKSIEQFKGVFARFMGTSVKEIIGRKLSEEEVNKIINRTDEGVQVIFENQIEIIAHQRVILSLLASIKKPGKTEISDNVRNTLQMMVEEEKEKVLTEKKLKA